MKPYLTYYNKHKIIPAVKENNKNLNILTKQRNNLFDQLKIDKKLFKNSNILEVGPGTGYNAKYLINSGVKSITLVDGNTSSINSIKKTLNNVNKNKYKIINKDFYDLKLKKKFDFVICENVISGVSNPNLFLKKLSSYVSNNGYLITNCSDNVSLFSEKIRGVISYLFLETQKHKDLNFQKKTKFLSKLFNTHINSLGKNTRQIDDWVQDVLLYEYWWRKKNYFSLHSAVKTVKKDFKFYSSSPSCFSNYTWYKKIDFDANKFILNDFFKIQQNFFDNRTPNYLFTKKQNLKFNALINKASSQIYSLNSKNLINLTKTIKKISQYFIKLKNNELTKNSLKQVVNILEDFQNKKKIDKNKIKKISSWWGYATQYIVLKKK